MKRVLPAIITMLFCVLCFNQVLAAASEIFDTKSNIGIVINGENVKSDKAPVMKNQRILVPSKVMLQKLGVTVEWDAENNTFSASKGGIAVKMKMGEKALVINGEKRNMDVAPFVNEGMPMIPLRYIAEAFKYNVRWEQKDETAYITTSERDMKISRGDSGKHYVVVIDAGHGGSETGAQYYGVDEKNLNLDIAKKLDALLTAEGVKTFMTRTDDSYVGLYERSGLANNVNADLLISVHNNACDSPGFSGSMSLYYPGTANANGKLSALAFANIVQKEMLADLNTKDAGVVPRPNLAVLRTSRMPAVIAEIGYMTNKAEMERLKTDEFRQKAAEALKNAVMAALDKI